MNLSIFYIQKKLDTNEFAKKYFKLISAYATLKERNLFNNQIAKAANEQIARAATSEAFNQASSKSAYKIALSEDGKQLNSLEFAALLADKIHTEFFIGGAYGLEDSFKSSCNICISLSKLTTTHELARVLLLEQLYRACTINAAHPYHK